LRWWWPAWGQLFAVALPVLAMVAFCRPCSGPDPSAFGRAIFMAGEGLLASALLTCDLLARRTGRWEPTRSLGARWIVGAVPAWLIAVPTIEQTAAAIQYMICPIGF
jgi:hypothetical protein